MDTKTNPYDALPPETERVATLVVDAAFKVHSTLGPGLLESVYETCLVHELKGRGLTVQRQISFPVVYDNLRLDAGLRLDLLVEDQVVVELKAVEKLLPIFDAHTTDISTAFGKSTRIID